MKLHDVNVGDTLQLVFKEEDKEFTTECDVAEVRNEYVLVEQIHSDAGVPAVIKRTPWYIRVIYQQEDGIPVIWDRVPAMDIQVQGKTMHIMAASWDGLQQNRRNAFRMRINLPCILFLNENTKKLPAQLKDISGSGFAFLLNSEMDAMGQTVMIRFKDEELLKTIEITGRVIRTQKENGKFLYGCIIISGYLEAEKYVADRQRMRQKDRLGL